MIKRLEARVGQFLLCFKCAVSRDNVVQEQVPLGEFPLLFSYKMPFNCTSRDK